MRCMHAPVGTVLQVSSNPVQCRQRAGTGSDLLLAENALHLAE